VNCLLKLFLWFFITLADIIQNNHHHQQHLNHLNHHLHHSDTSEDSKMHSEHNGGSNGSIGHHLQYITLGNNIVATSTTAANTPTSDSKSSNSGPKTWTPSDMESALEALRSHNMSLTKASATYGIPSTTLWQRAHRLGIGE
jgi:transcriptional regulator of acetoin/glycerol metabolism